MAMLDTPQELLERIRLGEDSRLELKEVRFSGDRVSAPSRGDLADELAALANGRGGVLVLGVDDRAKDILGIPPDRLELVAQFVSELCNDSIEPPLVAFIERMQLPDTQGQLQPVLKVEVDQSLFVHRSPGGYFHRVGISKRPMRAEYLATLMQQRSQTRLVRFDEQPVARATLDSLAPELWQRFRTDRSDDSTEDFLRKLGMAAPDPGGVIRPTVAGVLLASRDPREWIPNAFIQAVAYRGETPSAAEARDTYQLDAKDISGPLDDQIIEGCRFVHRNMKIGATKDIGRRDIPQYDLRAVFEALVNAVVHRDYAVHGSKIRLRMFSNRLELYSPGDIANTMTIESLPYRQAARNETLASLLAKCSVPSGLEWIQTDRRTLMDRRGEGVGIILKRSRDLAGRVPEYRLIDDAELLLTIYAANGGVAAREAR
jgi:predicted HTH transcriptional regulator